MWLLFQPLHRLPRSAGRRLGALYGDLAWLLLPGLRRRARGNLSRAFPDWPSEKVESTARANLRWVGRTGADFLRLGRRDHETLLRSVRVEGWEHWRRAERMGRGIVVVTGHLGNWELLGAWISALGRTVRVLYHPFHEERLDRLVRARRERAGVIGIPADRGAPRALRALRRGEVLGVLVDRVPRGAAVACRFFGRECRTATGAAWLAVRAGAPVLPAAMWLEGDGGYRLRFEPPSEGTSPEGDREAWVVALTRRMTAVLEEQVREAPEQWPWFFDRWKIRSGPTLGGPPAGIPAEPERRD